jgi:L-asparaginase
MKLRIIVTGGTFDKEYNELSGELFFKDTHVLEMLTLGRNRTDVSVQTLFMKDSLHLTDTDREQIAAACISAPESQIVITHGTDTMAETARLLAEKLNGKAEKPDRRNEQLDESIAKLERKIEKLNGKTIVLTGAMVPYKFGSSDGLFNLGSALAFVQTLSPGVYVAMNGRCFPAATVWKNKSSGFFEAAEQPID